MRAPLQRSLGTDTGNLQFMHLGAQIHEYRPVSGLQAAIPGCHDASGIPCSPPNDSTCRLQEARARVVQRPREPTIGCNGSCNRALCSAELTHITLRPSLRRRCACATALSLFLLGIRESSLICAQRMSSASTFEYMYSVQSELSSRSCSLARGHRLSRYASSIYLFR